MKRAAIVAIPLALALSHPATAQADGVQVAPVLVMMDAARGTASVRIRNLRTREVSFEVDLYTWDQVDGVDVHAPTADLIAAPRIFAIAPGEEQILRIARAGPGRASVPEEEIAYRLLLRELPSPEPEATGFRVQLTMSLPVFVPSRASHTQLAATRVIEPAQGPSIRIENTGSAHIRLAAIAFGPSEERLDSVPRYLLAGRSITRPLARDVGEVEITYAGADNPAPLTTTFSLHAPRPLPQLR
jgi:fimbrial chaperone protein